MDMTARFGLPLLAVAQAAKEMTVNEALTAIDGAVQPVVAGQVSAPPSSPSIGQSWLVADGATGSFAGHDGVIATWTAGGWRYVVPFEGMNVWRSDANLVARRSGADWQSGAPVAAPSGGSVVDSEARAAIGAILTQLRNQGLIAP